MLSKLVTKMAKNAFQNAQKQYKDKAKKIRAGKGTTQEKLDKLYEAGEAFQKKKKMNLKNDAIAAKKGIRPKKKKPAVKVSPGGKGKDAPAKPIGQMGLRKMKKPTTRELQTKVLMKAKTNNMTGKNFRMKNPKDKDVQALYKANPNLKKSDASRQEGRDYQKAFKKAKTPAQKVRVINKQRKKQLAEYVREENEKLAYKGLTESDLKRLINSRAKKLEMSVSEYKRLKFDNPFVKELNKRKGK